VGEEGTAPGGLGVAHATGHDVGWQPADRTLQAVKQPGLAGQALPVANDLHQVTAAWAGSVDRDGLDVQGVSEQLADLVMQPAGGGGVELDVDHDPSV
jgi:hypothetical protein